VSKKTSPSDPTASLEEAAIEGWDVLKKYQTPIVAVIVTMILIVVGKGYQESENENLNTRAWTALYSAEQDYKKIESQPKKDRKEGPKFEQVSKDFKGHAVEPFALLKQANALYKDGDKEDLTKAKGLLEEFLKRYKKLDIYKDMAETKIKNIDAELAHAPSWIPVKEEKKEETKSEVEHDHDGDGKPDHGPDEHEPKKDGQ
jgi:hypothetical protein